MTFITYLNEQFSMIQNVDFFIRILLACVCGFCIGFERSRRFKEAGIRTHVIVCCAAALLMIISKYSFADLTIAGEVFNGTRGADPARIAAQVVSGISFLGAGVIFKHGNTIKGLTTAAGIWATAGIGLAVGSGMVVVGIFTTIVICLLQVGMHHLLPHGDAMETNRIRFTVYGSGELPTPFLDFITKYQVQIIKNAATRQADDSIQYDMTLKAPHDLMIRSMNSLFASKDVADVHCTAAEKQMKTGVSLHQ